MELRSILSVVTVLLFLSLLFVCKNVRRTYILYVLLMFPFMDLSILPANLGGFEVFELITFFCFIFVFKNIRFSSIVNSTYFILFLILTAILLLGAIFSEFPGDSLLSYLKYFPIFIYAKLLLDECYEDPGFISVLIKTLRLMCVISLVFLAFQMYFGLNFTFYAHLNPNTQSNDVTRYPSFFPEAQVFAQYLSMMSFLFIVTTKSESKYKFINYLLYLITICALFISGGRAAFLGLCVGLFFVLIFANLKFKLIGLAFLLVGSFVIVSFQQHFTLFNRDESVDESFEFRYNRWKEAYHIFELNPILGIGIDNYRNYVTRYLQDQYWESEDQGVVYYDNPENGYLKVLTEYGGLGFIIALSFLVLPIKNSFNAYLRKRVDFKSILVSASVISWMISFITVYTLTDLRVYILLATLVCFLISFCEPSIKNYNANAA